MKQEGLTSLTKLTNNLIKNRINKIIGKEVITDIRVDFEEMEFSVNGELKNIVQIDFDIIITLDSDLRFGRPLDIFVSNVTHMCVNVSEYIFPKYSIVHCSFFDREKGYSLERAEFVSWGSRRSDNEILDGIRKIYNLAVD